MPKTIEGFYYAQEDHDVLTSATTAARAMLQVCTDDGDNWEEVNAAASDAIENILDAAFDYGPEDDPDEIAADLGYRSYAQRRDVLASGAFNAAC